MKADQAGQVGRPRSEEAREAVLRAVDDLVVEIGYAAMTMKGIAERAGVGRQTVYRWWSTKAEILLEASAEDAREELYISPTGDALRDVTSYLRALIRFLTRSAAGSAYRALVGEAQHDPAVAALLAGEDVLMDSARAVLSSIAEQNSSSMNMAAADLVGPVFFWVLAGHDASRLKPATIARDYLRRAATATT